ncbi:hypothetical protein EVAR_14847_1 [Eumeta japonica]|uniref:Uncharacterized protein n=1 Tax=Eumeta variegata TaxID=151549 RepID=A0A4C1V469_EUMVA|nr:hypothetical protein EVAR_14847_1 [Eumeta japonica]
MAHSPFITPHLFHQPIPPPSDMLFFPKRSATHHSSELIKPNYNSSRSRVRPLSQSSYLIVFCCAPGPRRGVRRGGRFGPPPFGVSRKKPEGAEGAGADPLRDRYRTHRAARTILRLATLNCYVAATCVGGSAKTPAATLSHSSADTEPHISIQFHK